MASNESTSLFKKNSINLNKYSENLILNTVSIQESFVKLLNPVQLSVQLSISLSLIMNSQQSDQVVPQSSKNFKKPIRGSLPMIMEEPEHSYVNYPSKVIAENPVHSASVAKRQRLFFLRDCLFKNISVMTEMLKGIIMSGNDIGSCMHIIYFAFGWIPISSIEKTFKIRNPDVLSAYDAIFDVLNYSSGHPSIYCMREILSDLGLDVKVCFRSILSPRLERKYMREIPHSFIYAFYMETACGKMYLRVEDLIYHIANYMKAEMDASQGN